MYQLIADAWYGKNCYDSALLYYKLAKDGFERIADSAKISENLNNIGICYTISGNYDSAEHYFVKAIQVSKNINDSLGLKDLYQNIGNLYGDRAMIDEAATSYIDALKLNKLFNDSTGVLDIAGCLAYVFMSNNDTTQADYYLDKGMSYISSSTPLISLAGFYCIKGEVEFLKGNYSAAKEWYHQLIEVSERAKYKRGLAAGYSNMASVYSVEKDFERAVNYHKNALIIEQDIGNVYGIINSLCLVSETYMASNSPRQAINFLSQAYELSKDYGVNEHLTDITYNLYSANKVLGNTSLAIGFLEEYKDVYQRRSGSEVIEKVKEIEAKYENEKAKRQIDKLNSQALIQQQQIRSRGLQLILLTLIFTVGVVFSILIYRQAKLKNQFVKLELEQKLLRAQLRPHFVFNVLNSLRYLIQSDQKQQSLLHLGSFSRLMRKTLHQTSQNFISLQDEIDAVDDYVTLESAKFNGELSFSILVSKDVNPSELLVPPFILQPFVENSLVHGLASLEGEKRIDIQIKLSEDDKNCICIEIADNGVGITSPKNNSKHKSIGSSLTQKRIAYFNQQNGYTGSAVAYVGSRELNANKKGTTVFINIAKMIGCVN